MSLSGREPGRRWKPLTLIEAMGVEEAGVGEEPHGARATLPGEAEHMVQQRTGKAPPAHLAGDIELEQLDGAGFFGRGAGDGADDAPIMLGDPYGAALVLEMRGDGVEFGNSAARSNRQPSYSAKQPAMSTASPSPSASVAGRIVRSVTRNSVRAGGRHAGIEAGLVDVAAWADYVRTGTGRKASTSCRARFKSCRFCAPLACVPWDCVSSMPRMGASLLNPSTFLSLRMVPCERKRL